MLAAPSSAPRVPDERYRPTLAKAASWMLTVGTTVRVAGELVRAESDARWLRRAVLAAGMMQVTGLLTFFANM